MQNQLKRTRKSTEPESCNYLSILRDASIAFKDQSSYTTFLGMKIRPIITACSIGNFLEWYDYALYGYLTSILARMFFPQDENLSALLNVAVLFAIGFLMRPLGSIIFGLIGDRKGRKIGLILSILLMIVPTCSSDCCRPMLRLESCR